MEYIWFIILGLAGMGVSYYIKRSVASNTQMICKLGGDCNRVVTSRWANIFGLDNTIMGLLYYGLITAGGIGQLLFPATFALPSAYWIKVAISGGAFVFSIYLTYVQGAILKDWCQWCIMSAVLSTIIFLVALL